MSFNSVLKLCKWNGSVCAAGSSPDATAWREAESSEEPDQQEAPETKGSSEKPSQEGSKVPYVWTQSPENTGWFLDRVTSVCTGWRMEVLVLITWRPVLPLANMLVSTWLMAAVCLLQVDNTDDDDCHSNKSLDLNFGRKLIDFKLSTSSSSSAPQEEQTPSTSAPQESLESSEEKPSSSCSPTVYKHVCQVCRKTFRYATTLARHERAHLSEEAPHLTEEYSPAKEEEAAKEGRAADEEKEELETTEVEEAKGAESEGGERGESEEEKEERSDEEASEPKTVEGGGGGRVDKRKKICNECGKRFWSLQDLTRHLRSHTGSTHTWAHTHLLVWHQRWVQLMKVWIWSLSLQASAPTSVRPARGPSPWSTVWSGTRGSTWGLVGPTGPLAPTMTPARTETPLPPPQPPPARPRRTKASVGVQAPRSWRRRRSRRRLKVSGTARPRWGRLPNDRTRVHRPLQKGWVGLQQRHDPPLTHLRELLNQRWQRTLPKTPPPAPLQETPPPSPLQRASSRGCWRSTPSPPWSTSFPTESLLWWGWTEGAPRPPQCHTTRRWGRTRRRSGNLVFLKCLNY